MSGEAAPVASAVPTPPTARPTSAPAPTKPRRSSGAWGVAALVVLAAIAAAGYWTYREGYFDFDGAPIAQVQPPPAAQPAAPEQDAVAAATADVEAREAVMRQELASLAPRLDALEQAVAALSQSVDQIAASQQSVQGVNVKDFADRIARLEEPGSLGERLGAAGSRPGGNLASRPRDRLEAGDDGAGGGAAGASGE